MLITLLIVVLVVALLLYLVETLPLSAQSRTILRVLIALIAILWLLRVLGVGWP